MRRVRRKGGNKEKVFGCDLLEYLNASSQEIPLVLRCCSEFVEKHGVVDGIYRLSGVSSNIQKLRGEFESDGSPDLNKDLYLQDIHCVSSLCKAYFRELPNPLLTYQLYDKFAEAVAIQLEEDRLVKIRDVLKELPTPHYRTLEFLMRHLVRMASYSSETNMHSRNLAIVWAPNLLRSKDIEASGFNGTAAFMEVRVQSIVVEFILTHVPQLFPEQGVSSERRKSLPSPSAASCQEEFLKSVPTQHFPNFGHISPGDGPFAMRPYHAIIEGTDKRKGSLKGRKWMSIFNIGGRFPDPRRRHKHSAKEKDRTGLRPARSMDSLSIQAYPNQGPKRAAQQPPPTSTTTTTLLVTSSPKCGMEVTPSTGAIGGSEYAVTYRRGTGLVSGGAGTQGTYTALDPESSGVTGHETLQSRSPGLTTKVGRRAAMHITGPTLVTVPLHITSNLALGVLQGGGGDRVIHRGREKDEGKEGGEKVERKERRAQERKVEEDKKVEKEDKNHRGKGTKREGVVAAEGKTVTGGGGGDKEGEAKKEEEEKEEEEEEVVTGGGVFREQRVKSFNSNAEKDDDEEAVNEDKDVEDEYMDMKGVKSADVQLEESPCVHISVFDASDVLNSTADEEEDDQGLSGYVQDNFDFLDQMDCSVLDHMDCSGSYQVNEFSVEPPGHSDDEYEVMAQAQLSGHPAELRPETHGQSPTELNPHRPLSLDVHTRHTKSLSLPYMISPVRDPEESSSEEEAAGDDSDAGDYSSDDDESMFVKSLPADFFLSNLAGLDTDGHDDEAELEGVPAGQLRSSEERDGQSPAGDQEQVEVEDEEDDNGLEEKKTTEKEEEKQVHLGRDQPENSRQSSSAEGDRRLTEDAQSDKEQPLTSEASTLSCTESPRPSIDGPSIDGPSIDEPSIDEPSIDEPSIDEPSIDEPSIDEPSIDEPSIDEPSIDEPSVMIEVEKEVADGPHRDFPPCHAVSADVPLDTNERDGDGGEDRKECEEMEDTRQDIVLEIKDSDENMLKETAEEVNEVIADKHEGNMQGGGTEPESAMLDELEMVICEVIEEEEREQAEKKGARESVAGEEDTIEGVEVGEEEEQVAEVSGETMVQVDEGGSNETEARIEVVEESAETTQEKLAGPEVQQEFELDEAIKGKRTISDEARHQVLSKEQENNDEETAAEQRGAPPSVDKPLRELWSDVKEWTEGRKCEEGAGSQGGVGRKLVVSKHPRVYQAKAVPVVPPKPQHCKITALTLRQQQQQRERRDADRGREDALKVPTEQDRGRGERDEGRGRKDQPSPRGGEKERERRRDGDDRNSPLSMCFDEAVAIATMRREKDKECEKVKEWQRDWGSEVQ